MIAASTRIPKRILLGSERGELAASQDERAWRDRIASRQADFCETQFVRPFVDRMIETGIVSGPTSEDYKVDWPDIHAPSERDVAEVGEIRARAAALYASSPGIAAIIPLAAFYDMIMGLSREDAEELLAAAEEVPDEETVEPVAPPTAPDVPDEEGVEEVAASDGVQGAD